MAAIIGLNRLFGRSLTAWLAGSGAANGFSFHDPRALDPQAEQELRRLAETAPHLLADIGVGMAAQAAPDMFAARGEIA